MTREKWRGRNHKRQFLTSKGNQFLDQKKPLGYITAIFQITRNKDIRSFQRERKSNQIVYKESEIKMADFSTASLKQRRLWSNTFKVLMGKNVQPGIL